MFARQVDSDDPFGRVLGAGRGVSDAAAVREELAATEASLARALAELEEARRLLADRDELVEGLMKDLVATRRQRDHAKARERYVEASLDEVRFERDRARYAAVRAGLADPAYRVEVSSSQAPHQRKWTPRRPYLAYQHVWHPRTGECYSAGSCGAPAGELPGTGPSWRYCVRVMDCPEPPENPKVDHPAEGPALRQSKRWWDRHNKVRLLGELTDEHLAKVIEYLRTDAPRLFEAESRFGRPFLPNPVNAYPTAQMWMADTVLMRALLNERRNRRRRSAGTSQASGLDERIPGGGPGSRQRLDPLLFEQ